MAPPSPPLRATNSPSSSHGSPITPLNLSQNPARPFHVFRHTSSGWGKHPTSVYIRDSIYAWLPAHVVKTDDDAGTALVSIKLPEDWYDYTVLSPDSDLEEASDKQLLRQVNLLDYPNGELPLQNLNANGDLLVKRDMADLHFLHEAAILYNLKARHGNGRPYTRVGDIVVAMNPFQWFKDLYSKEKQSFYAEQLIWNAKDEEEEEKEEEYVDEGDDATQSSIPRDPLSHGAIYDKLGYDPHVYETSSLAYRGLAMDRQNQTILVSGESGAGKTETVKIVMTHIATVEKTRPFFKYTTKQTGNKLGPDETVRRVLESNPVFEAFGNAKTIRNDNSSRFGKFTQLQFDVEDSESAERAGRAVPACLLAGSFCTTYLLEKSRVVSHSVGERTYHILYQLLAAPDEFKADIWRELAGKTNESFKYVGYTDTNAIEGCTDVEGWDRSVEALSVFGLEGDSLRTLMRALCIVLQLGNLTFDLDPAADIEEGCSVITSREELEKLSDLMGIDSETIELSMTTRLMKTRYDEVVVHLRPSVAKEGCDALAKEIYARVFDVLVGKINDYTQAERHYEELDIRGKNVEPRQFGIISLLDIFGFECFEVNRFEQFCINYANERLQQKYVLDNFKAVQQEYEAEGIEIFDFAVVDNSDVLSLLEGRIGLIVSLNEECIRPKGNDESFVYKAKMVHSDSMTLISEKLHRKTEFGVNHFAGPVTYNAEKFVERNTDKLPQDLMECACMSTNDLIRDEFQTLASEMDKGKKAGIRRKSSMFTSHTVLTKFKSQLVSLMSSIENTRTRYIRCIKPNETMDPRLTDHYVTMRQLECAGLVTAITISRESFPNRLGYQATNERFRCLSVENKTAGKGESLKDAVKELLSELLRSMAEFHRDGTVDYPFACGKTRVYFRAGALERLEMDRMEYFTVRAVLLQRWARSVVARRNFVAISKAVVALQARCRGRSEWRSYNRQRHAAIVLQSWSRVALARAEAQSIREYNAAVWIQTRWRARKPKTALIKFRKAAAVIQRAMRKKRNQSNFTAKLAVCVEEARMDTKLSHLQKQVASETVAKGVQRSVDEKLLEEIEMMFDYLRKEIYKLRGKNADLRAELKEAEADKRDLLAHAEAAEAASSLARLRVSQLSKTNTALISEVMGHKNEVTALKRELRSKDSVQQEDIVALKCEYEKAREERDNEINSLRQQLKSTRAAHKFETDMLKDQLAKAEEEHVAEVLRYKDELRRTQDSHHDYLAKLMDVLETTHAARESETARINEELREVRDEKDAKIAELQREVETLRTMHTDDARSLNKALRLKSYEISSMKMELERSSSARSRRSEKFNRISDLLEQKLSESESPQAAEVTRSLIGRRKSRPSSSGSLQNPEDVTKMKKMVRSMRDLYELEATTHAKVDEDTLRMMDNFILVAEPDQAVERLRKEVAARKAENKELKKELETKYVCRACEFRKGRARPGSRSAF